MGFAVGYGVTVGYQVVVGPYVGDGSLHEE
jgi:hypothetical protein